MSWAEASTSGPGSPKAATMSISGSSSSSGRSMKARRSTSSNNSCDVSSFSMSVNLMKAAVFDEFGGPEVLRIDRVPVPVPAPGEVLVRVRASALNHLDLWLRRGLPIETTMPHIGGSDIAGEVMGMGAGVGVGVGAGVGAGVGVEVGARVVVNPSVGCGECEWCTHGEQPLCVDYKIIGEHLNGGFAEYVAVPAANVPPIP